MSSAGADAGGFEVAAEAEAQVRDVLASGGVAEARVRLARGERGSVEQGAKQWRALFSVVTHEGHDLVVVMDTSGFRAYREGELEAVLARRDGAHTKGSAASMEDAELLEALCDPKVVAGDAADDKPAETMHVLLQRKSPKYSDSFGASLFSKLQALADAQAREEEEAQG